MQIPKRQGMSSQMYKGDRNRQTDKYEPLAHPQPSPQHRLPLLVVALLLSLHCVTDVFG